MRNKEKNKETYILKNGDQLDGVIVLTESQKNDIIRDYNLNNVSAISNFIEIPDVVNKPNNDSKKNSRYGF